jgi:hypothetical protein
MATNTIPYFINQINITQDAELAAFVNQLKSNTQQWASFVNDQENKIYKDIKKSKNDTIGKIMSDAGMHSDTLYSYLQQRKRSNELATLLKDQLADRKKGAEAIVEDKHLATRSNEMNEWTVGNKQDTLFVFSSLFIMLSGLVLLTVLWRMGTISSSVWVLLGAPLILIFVLILARRYFYTAHLRNKRYWNKQIFEGTQAKIPIPSCDTIQNTLSGTPSSIPVRQ